MPLSGAYYYPGVSGANVGATKGVTITNNNEMFGYKAKINLQSASYNLQASDTGKIIELSNSVGGRLFLPSDLSRRFCLYCSCSYWNLVFFSFRRRKH